VIAMSPITTRPRITRLISPGFKPFSGGGISTSVTLQAAVEFFYYTYFVMSATVKP
jgi:hypothetical protein